MNDKSEPDTEEAASTYLSFCCKFVVFSVALTFFVVKMCFKFAFCRNKNEIDYYKGERTVTITAPDGSRIVAHKKERVEKGKLKEAEGSVTQYGSNQGEEIWSRQWGGGSAQQ